MDAAPATHYIDCRSGVDTHRRKPVGDSEPTILYVNCCPASGMGRVRLAGIRRYAAARKWRVETLPNGVCTPAALRDALARFRPVGCVAECWSRETALRPAHFGRVPVVYFDPPNRPGWRNARGIVCNEAAVAQMAFRELSAGQPQSFAVLSFFKGARWERERINVFRECCRKAGFDCPVTYFEVNSYAELPERAKLLAPWAAALPPHCAVFAVNDFCALGAARAMLAAGRSFPRTVTLCGADGVATAPRDRDLAGTISTIKLDFEHSGYLAAKAIGENVANATFPPLLVDRRKSTRGYGRREPSILKAMEMIRREACDGLTVAELASRFRGTRRLFEIRFREAAGHTALDEILNVRMERAMDLLARSDMTIAAVAHFCGFKTEWEFWDLFRRRTGMPPLRFRNGRK